MKLAKFLSVVIVLGAAALVSGCAGSLGWNSATALPRGSYDEERIDRVGPRSSRSPCGASTYDYDYSRSREFQVPTGYMLVPQPTAASPCQ